MFYIVETKKSPNQALSDFLENVKKFGYGHLVTHDLDGTMAKKGIDLGENCKIIEICHPHHAQSILNDNMQLSLFLPCKVNIYTDEESTYIGFLKLTSLMDSKVKNDELKQTLRSIEEQITDMVESAK